MQLVYQESDIESKNKRDFYFFDGKYMTPQQFSKIFWKQYLLLEKDFLETDEYVTISKGNFDTFSHRFTYLFLNICSELDSIAEEYCKVVDPKAKVNNIIKKVEVILNNDQSIKDQKRETKYPYERIHLVPFAKFNSEGAADWWKSYNLVKHFRADVPEKGVPNYQRANLKNVIQALAALHILCKNLYKKLDGSKEDLEESKLFEG